MFREIFQQISEPHEEYNFIMADITVGQLKEIVSGAYKKAFFQAGCHKLQDNQDDDLGKTDIRI